MMHKTLIRKTINGHDYNILTLPGTNLFKFEIVNLWGANIERVIQHDSFRNFYGLSHFIEHLGFRVPKDYTTNELLHLLKTEGTYNASTDHDRINYWFKTTSDRMDTAIRLVCNYALNDLTNIPEDEFQIEKKVVYNEAKRYADDDQTMFYFNLNSALCGLHAEDNVIGIPETIDNFTLADAIEVKDHFLQHGKQVFNVTYDPQVTTEDAVLNKIESELNRFVLPKANTSGPAYYKHLGDPAIGQEFVLENESEQAMTALTFDVIDNITVARTGNAFLSQLATETSLNDVIREQHGLTYGIHFYDNYISYNPYTTFACDVSKGTEDFLLELFNQSINLSVDAFNEEAHKNLIQQLDLKRTLSMIDQQKYDGYLWEAIWNPTIIDKYEEHFATNIDRALVEIDNCEKTFDNVKSYLDDMQTAVNDGKFSKVTN